MIIVFLGGQFLPSGSGGPQIRAEERDDKPFLKILNSAYQVSCQDVEALRNFYFKDAEIIHNGRQITLEETIKELEKSVSSMKDLSCHYQPKVRARRHGKKMTYLVVRETIRLSAPEMDEILVQQICTYIFRKNGSDWKITHDHCSSVPGLAV